LILADSCFRSLGNRVRFLVPPVNDQISDAGNPSAGVAEDNHAMLIVKNRIQQEQQRPGQI
jgi:hypothetical protein